MSNEIKRSQSDPGEFTQSSELDEIFSKEKNDPRPQSLGEITQEKLNQTISLTGEEFRSVEEDASSDSYPLSGRATYRSTASSSSDHRSSFAIGSQRKSRRSSRIEKEHDNTKEASDLSDSGSKRGERHLSRQLKRTLMDLKRAQACVKEELMRQSSPDSSQDDLGYDDFVSRLEQEESTRKELHKEASRKLQGAFFLTKGKWRSEKEGLEKKGSRILDQRSAIERLKAQYDVILNAAGDICRERNALLLSRGEAALGKNFQADYPLSEPHKAAWRDFDSWIEQIIFQFPPVLLNVVEYASIGAPPLVDNFNNYGLIPDSGSIKRDESGNILSFKLHGSKIVPAKDGHGTSQAIEKEGLLFFKHNEGALHYHDCALSSFSSASSFVVTLCDGTGQYQSSKIAAELAAKTSHYFGVEAIASCRSLQEAMRVHFISMKKAEAALIESTEALQGTTLIQLSVTGNILCGVAVGDSRAFLFSRKEAGGWRCRDLAGESRKSLDPRDSGGRLSGMKDLYGRCHDLELAGMRAFAVSLNPGDILYVCSDGGYDNFDPSQIQGPDNTPEALGGQGDEWDLKNPDHIALAKVGLLRNLEAAVKDCETAEDMHGVIIKISQARTERDKLYYMTTPLSEMQLPPKVAGQGKGDDMAMVFFQFIPK